jgi:hypothetical protein
VQFIKRFSIKKTAGKNEYKNDLFKDLKRIK